MGRTAVSTQLGFMGTIACADIRADLPKIACPTLVITTEESGLGSVDATRAWQQQIPDSELLVLPGNSYHVAATHADQSAQRDARLHRAARRLEAGEPNRRPPPSPLAGAGRGPAATTASEARMTISISAKSSI